MSSVCVPFKHTICRAAYNAFVRFLANLEGRPKSRRYSEDAIDVSIASQFAKSCYKAGLMKLAVFSCALMGHYGNNLQTWSVLLQARSGGSMDWKIFRNKVAECKVLFAKSQLGKGLHSRNCMPGHAFHRNAGDADYTVSETRGFRSMWQSSHFDVAASLIGLGIRSFADYKRVLSCFRALQVEVPGCLGEYHLKMALDHMVISGMLEKRFVSEWPVAPRSGTADGLRRIHACRTQSPAALREMLAELLVRLRRGRALCSSCWLGSIGAALCWQKRDRGSDGTQQRYDYTAGTSELELAVLDRLGIPIPTL